MLGSYDSPTALRSNGKQALGTLRQVTIAIMLTLEKIVFLNNIEKLCNLSEVSMEKAC